MRAEEGLPGVGTLTQGGQAFALWWWAVIGRGLLLPIGMGGGAAKPLGRLPREGCIGPPLATNTHVACGWVHVAHGAVTGLRRSSGGLPVFVTKAV